MYEYKFVEVESTLLGDKFKGCGSIINDYAEKGYRYAGYIPLAASLASIQLVFEKIADKSEEEK